MSVNDVIVITGASSGFGRAAAEVLSERGYNVFATMRDTEGRNARNCEALRSLAARNGLPLRVADMDVASDASVEKTVRQILDSTARIDVVINNAGIGVLGMTEGFTVEQFQQILEVNLLGAVRVNRAVLPAMRRQGSGLLIHVSSGAGRFVIPCMAAYCASKFALEALADSYRYELSPLGIDSVVVEPGIHRTPILERFIPPADSKRLEDYGHLTEMAERVRGRFHAASIAPDTPGPEDVVQAFVRLIETPAGSRPFRTVPTAALRPRLDPYNVQAEEIRQTVAYHYKIPAWLSARQEAPGERKS